MTACRLIMFLLLALTLLLPAVCRSSDDTLVHTRGNGREPDRYGLSVEAANTYDPGHAISFFLVTGFALYDYGKVWRQDRPKELCFKIEAAAGGTSRPQVRTVASAGMLALYFLDRYATPQLRPYVEAGIGVIYTDFRVTGQGLRFNFNPQLGFGAELPQSDGNNLFAAVRLHHLSNGDLFRDNRGVNSVILQVGRFF